MAFTLNYTLVLQEINRPFPGTESKLKKGYIKIFLLDDESYRKITNFLATLNFEYNAIKSRNEWPLKIVIKDRQVDTFKNCKMPQMWGHSQHRRVQHKINNKRTGMDNCQAKDHVGMVGMPPSMVTMVGMLTFPKQQLKKD
ncbi:hypothetical protein CDAR_24161 [Caerostris darwini]|uniref:Uncharacterized protein n=1 Tax=Caerostris darwini TaxID=1538125 RepID=A0AAV4QK49_9ARAC|nr:hypothetical protein CDAR_24161 [Caerostris darwini]